MRGREGGRERAREHACSSNAQGGMASRTGERMGKCAHGCDRRHASCEASEAASPESPMRSSLIRKSYCTGANVGASSVSCIGA